MPNFIILLILFNLTILSKGSYLSPSKNITFTFNNNIVVNSNLTVPVISPKFVANFGLSQSGWTTIGLKIQYIDVYLLQQNLGDPTLCRAYSGITPGRIFLDTDSSNFNEKYYQNFTLGAGEEYQISFDWISTSPVNSSNGVNVTWNGNMVDSFYNGQCTLSSSIYYVISVNGTNTMAFQGIGRADSYGLMITNIQLRQLIYQSNTTNTSNSNITTNTSNSNITTNISNSNITTNTSNSNTTNTSNSNTTNISNSNILNTSSSLSQIKYPVSYSTMEDLAYLVNGTEYQQLLEIITQMNINKAFSFVNIVNSLKQNAKFAMGFILEFNHFLLYNTHLINYTITSEIIIIGMQFMEDQKGHILDVNIYPLLETNPQKILRNFYQQNNIPLNPNRIGSLLHFRPNGILLDIADTVFMAVPVTIVIFLLGFFLFKMLYHYRISLLFRQYSILGLFFIILLDGRIQILTFEFLSEVLLLTTSYFDHKIKTVLIIFVYFMCFVFAIASMLIYRWFYRKLLKHVYDNFRKSLYSTFSLTLNYGLYNIILGSLHRLLLYYPLYQLYALITFEILYLICIFLFLLLNFYHNKFLALVLCMMNATRIAFLITLLAYQKGVSSQEDISFFQVYLFYIFIGFWILSSIVSIIEKIRLCFHIIVVNPKGKRDNKVIPQTTQIEPFSRVYVLSKDKNNITRIDVKYTISNNSKPQEQKINKSSICQNNPQRIFKKESVLPPKKYKCKKQI